MQAPWLNAQAAAAITCKIGVKNQDDANTGHHDLRSIKPRDSFSHQSQVQHRARYACSRQNDKLVIGKSNYAINYTIDDTARRVTVRSMPGNSITKDDDASGNMSKASVKIDEDGLGILTENDLLTSGFMQLGKLISSTDWAKDASEKKRFNIEDFLIWTSTNPTCTIQSES